MTPSEYVYADLKRAADRGPPTPPHWGKEAVQSIGKTIQTKNPGSPAGR
jgi:hypothetical protein